MGIRVYSHYPAGQITSSAPFVEDVVFPIVYNFRIFVKYQMAVIMCIHLGLLFSSLDWHICFCAGTMLFLLLQLYNIA